MLHSLIGAFVVLFIIFVPLERLFPLHKEQAILRKGWFNDLLHFFLNRFLVLGGTFAIVAVPYVLFQKLFHTPFQVAVTSQPAWLQFIEAFVVAEIAFYAIHRLAHTVPWLWKFHAIHHSLEEMDWLASARLHPVDLIVANVVVGLPLALLGFSEATFGIYSLWGAVQAIFIHSNLRFRFGPLRWLTATPEFHHWHHANEAAAINKNFGFPLIDLILGTAYMPEGQWPARYGIDEHIPLNYLKQLTYPFRKTYSKK